MKLQTDFKDDILDEEMNGKRRVKLIPLSDGTYIIEDVTKYTQIGSEYGQKEINQLNETVNGKLDSEKVIDDLNTALAVTENGVPAGCKAIGALNNNLTDSSTGISFQFGIDAEGNYGYYKVGADTVTPFSSGSKPELLWTNPDPNLNSNEYTTKYGYIAIDLSGYESIAVVFNQVTNIQNGGNISNVVSVPDSVDWGDLVWVAGATYTTAAKTDNKLSYRRIRVSKSGINYAGQGGADSERGSSFIFAIIREVYGYKKKPLPKE